MKQRTHSATLFGVITLIVTLFALGRAFAQTTNAFDQASDPAYAGLGAPNGLGTGGQNGGTGFGAWTFTVTGNGGSFIQNNGPSGSSFDLWNTSANNGTTAVRPFSTALSPGQSFLVALRLNSLDNGNNTNRFALEDASGNILFSYWHVGGDNLNGWYSDASVATGVATNFQYAYQQFVTYKFTLNSATTYTFTDIGTGASFTGTIANTPIAQAAFIRRNAGSAPGNGQDYQFDQLTIISAAPPSFQSLNPGANALSVATNTSISLNIASGGVPLNTGSVSLKLDGNSVSPTVTGNSSLMGVSFTPAAAFGYGTTHTVQVVVQDNNTVSYTNSWSFTTGHGSLPVTLAGPLTTGGGNDLTIFTANGEGWLGTNYNTNSIKTLYVRFSMVFNDLNGETGSGGGYGGLHLMEDNAQNLIAGNAWISTNWSLDAGGAQMDLSPLLPVVLGDWHTIVERIDFVPGANDNVKVWLDPDFTQTEANQLNAPLTLSADVTFNNVRLRCGNGTASATWTNIVMAATSADVGFAAPANPQFQGQLPTPGSVGIATNTAIGAQVVVGGSPIQSVSLSIDGGVPVTPGTNISAGIVTVSYQPPAPLSSGTLHTVQLVAKDGNNGLFTNTWSFTTGFAALPIVWAGPFAASNGLDNIIFTAAKDGWIGTNYQGGVAKTIYVRFATEFVNLNQSGATWGGLEFYQDNTERLLTGKAGSLGEWSVASAVPDTDIPPVTTFVTNDWHTFVVRADYPSGGGNADIKVWLDPDFTQTEAAQPNTPLEVFCNNTFNNIRLRAGFTPASALFSNVMVAATSSGVGFVAPANATFQNYVPAINASSAPVSTPISLDVLFGSYGIGTNTVAMTLDGNPVNPNFTVTATSMGIHFQPPSAFAPGSAHTVTVSLTDSNNTPYSTSWSFTVDSYPSLPVTLAGPFDVSGGIDTTIWTSQNGWIGGGYGPNSTNTLYTRFSMVFFDFPQTDPNAGGSYGGLHFFQDNTERLLVGNAWLSTNWSADAKEAGELDLTPVVPIVAGEWHTMVVKSVYSSNAPAQETIWLDPDFTKSLNNQPQPPITAIMNNTFNNIRLRCGNGATYAEFTNIVMAASVQDLGFPAVVAPGLLNIQNGQLSWTGGGTLQKAPAVIGPWTDASNQSTPQSLSTTNTAEFYRLRQ